MRILPFFIFISLFFMKETEAQFPAYVKEITLKANKTVTTSGRLSDGVDITDLSWAWTSSNACFPGTQKKKFTGKHVFFHVDLAPHSILRVKLIPKNKSNNMSLYGYQIGQGRTDMVPNLTSCVTCEADYKWDYAKRGKTQDHTRHIRFNAINNSYTIVIGVAGADGLSSGDFDLEFFWETSEAETGTQKPVKMYSAKVVKGKTVAYKGDLANGTKIYDLSWAWNSSNACFPQTQAKKFNGNHILFITEIPRYSKMEIQLIPTDKRANMSLYAYEIGTNSNAYVPNLPSCVTCEAEHKWDYPKRGKTQNHTRTVHLNAINNPYKVVIGVAGANGLDKGEFIIRIKLESR